jgi:hypothetical protein
MKLKLLFCISILLFVHLTASAQTTITWDGGGSSNNWTDAANWDCNCLPAAGQIAYISTTFITATIHIDADVSVGDIQSNANIIVNPGVLVTLTGNFTLSNGADLTVNSTSTINAVNLVLSSVSISGPQVWNNIVTNHGTIVLSNSITMQESCAAGIPCGCTMTNEGTITVNGLGIAFDDHTQLTNNNIMTLNGTRGISTVLTTQNSTFINNGNFSSNTINYFGNTTNGAAGIITINNYFNEIDPVTFAYTSPFVCLSTFTNNGNITLSNPQGNAFYGIQVKNSATLNNTGTLNLTAQRYPIALEPSGTANITGSSTYNAVQQIYQAGIENKGTFNINTGMTSFNCTTNFRNLASGVFTIANCLNVNLYTLYNQGTTTNHGHITYSASNLSSASVTQLGTLTNHGIMVNSAFPVILSAAENPGLFAQRVMNLNCANFSIPDFISGTKTNITNTPTSGIYTDIALTTSAGTLNWAANTFTPNTNAIGLNILYLNVTKSGCASQVIPIRFQQPIASDIWYEDADGDGWGNTSVTTSHCGTFLAGYTKNIPDCNDNNPNIYPGAPELCNDQDYNCDGNINSALPAPSTWYLDLDGDGFGNIAVSLVSCFAPAGYVSNSLDCNDNNFQIKPGAPELCDNLDNNCNGSIDEGIPTGTLIFTNGMGTGQWSTPGNWNLGFVPVPCFDVIIPPGFPGGTVQISGMAQCRSINVGAGTTLNINNDANLTVMGSMTSGIVNNGTVIIGINANINISNTIGHGIDNQGTINTVAPVNPWDQSNITLSNIGQNGIQNNPSMTITCDTKTNFMLIDISNRGISNNGTMTFRGFISGFSILNIILFNSGTFHNYGALDFQNSTNLPEWNIYNEGTINNYLEISPNNPIYINLATPSSGANVSPKGIYNHSGATLHNYGNINAHGNIIAGSGAFINHPGSTIIGW